MKSKSNLINYLLDNKGLYTTERYLLAFRLKKARSKTKAKKDCVLNARIDTGFFPFFSRFLWEGGKRRKFWEGLK